MCVCVRKRCGGGVGKIIAVTEQLKTSFGGGGVVPLLTLVKVQIFGEE